jgi:hypothetical protein
MSGSGHASAQEQLPLRPAWSGASPAVAPRSRRGLGRQACLVLVLVAAVTAVAMVALSASTPRVTADDRGAAHALAALPLAAQGAVSRALGRDDPSYDARAVAGVLTLRNRGQRLVARFDGRGVEVRSGRAQLGMSLVGYGNVDALRPVAAASPRAQANRVEYGLGGWSVWYANGPLGLEQGFTLTKRPARDVAGALTLALALSGNLRPTLAHNTVTFTGAGGASLAYRGLVATDATGRQLPARIELVQGRLLIRVDDAGARYPLRIDPFIQQAKLTASDGAASNYLGYAVAVSGTTIVAGAYNATVGGNSAEGAVYVFVEPAGGWANATQTAKLTASDGAADTALGVSVAVSGNTIVAGASGATVGGNSGQGAAYVFVEPAGGWANATQTAKLTASDGAAFSSLGHAVAVSGATIVAGAFGATLSGNTDEGAVYVFVEPAGGWANATQTAKLTASDGAQGDELGTSVAVSAGTIVAGAPFVSLGAPGSYQGAAYVFVEPAGGWASATQTAKLTASDGAVNDRLGESVAISGATIVAGVSSAMVGTNSDQGAVYVFVEPAGGWANGTQAAKLTASDGAADDFLGVSVGVAGNTIVADAPYDLVGANSHEGAVYVFVEPAGGWANGTQTAKLTSSDGAANDEFGYSVAVSGATIVAGAPSAAVGGNNYRGAAYVFGSLSSAQPVLAGVAPSSGPPAGGTTVTITGGAFTGATKVVFGGVAATSFNVVSDTQIIAVSPAQTGAHYIVVTGPGGTSALVGAAIYTYKVAAPAITSISPSSGPLAGGTSVTITGSGFTGATKVAFGGVAATSFNVVSATQITAVSPAQAAGSHYIVVTGPGGTSPTVAAAIFTYKPPAPAITGISPSSGPAAGGTTVTITGSGFTGATRVAFGGVAATSFNVASATRITAVSPAETGAHYIVVTGPGGTSPTVSAAIYTYH